MKANIKNESAYWGSDGMGLVELQIPGEAINDICKSGSNDAAVAYWKTRIERPATATPEVLRRVLSEYGAWEAEELLDDDTNWERIVWSLAWNVAEDDATDEIKIEVAQTV